MDPDHSSEIFQRLSALERKLEVLTERVRRLEANPAHDHVVADKPPIQTQTIQEHLQQKHMFEPPQRPPYFPPRLQPISVAPQRPAPEKKDAEYLIGAQILPKLGAAMMLLGLTFLVVLAYSRGWITPAMMFGIEVAFCSFFVIAGIAKRNMKEEYGQILTGIGSCGLYLVFAGGNLYYHLYSGEMLIGLFLLLSLGNLAFSFWRSSRAFLILGLIGGLVTASVLPNLRSDHSILNAWIDFLILIPAALIVAKNKWLDMAFVLWIAATVALVPILNYGLPWFDKIACLYASSAICAVAYSWSYQRNNVDRWNVVTPIFLWVTGLIGLAVIHTPVGVYQFAAFPLLFGAIAYSFRHESKVWNAMLIGAIGVPITVAPFCYTPYQAAEILALLSIVCATGAWRFVPKVASIAAVVELALSTITYMQISYPLLPWRIESTLLLSLIAAVFLSGRALVKAYGRNEAITLSAMALCIPLFSRLSVVILGLPAFAQGSQFSITLVLVVFSYYALGLYLRTRWRSALIAFWIDYIIALVSYLAAAAFMNVPIDVGILIPLMVAPALSLTVTPDNVQVTARAWSAVIIGGLFTRLFVVITMATLHWPGPVAIIVGSVAYAVACFLAVWAVCKPTLTYAGWIMLSVAFCAYIFGWQFPLRLDIWLVSALMGCLILAGRATAQISQNRREFAIFIALAGWAAFSRWSWVLFALLIPSLDSSPAITIGWTAYFFGLIALGFAYRVPQFRYVSFAVLGATIAKILVIDLATTDAMIRVAVTIVASLVMLAVGYWYVRSKEHTPAKTS